MEPPFRNQETHNQTLILTSATETKVFVVLLSPFEKYTSTLFLPQSLFLLQFAAIHSKTVTDFLKKQLKFNTNRLLVRKYCLHPKGSNSPSAHHKD